MEKSISTADIVFDRIEEAILSGEFPKGSIITELKLSSMLQVSRTPIREALSRLRGEGLIEDTGKGALVLGIDENDLFDIYEVRSRIEGLAAAKCAENITESELKRLRDTLELQEFYTDKNEPERIRNSDSEFHKLIYSYCGSRTLEALLSELHRKVQRYRRASVENRGRAAMAVAEHRGIYEAIKERDPELAERLIKEHIKNARESIMKIN